MFKEKAIEIEIEGQVMEVVIGQNKGEQGYFAMMGIPIQEKEEK